MLINGQGIIVETEVRGSLLKFKVNEQTQEATENLKFYCVLTDNVTGYSLRVNKRPNFNRDLKRFFLRGSVEADNEKQVKIKFETPEKAQEALSALERLIAQVVPPVFDMMQHNDQMGEATRGGTSDFRFSFINRAMAQRLNLTGKNLYPVEIVDVDPTTKSVVVKSAHATQHLAQGFDVLTKACGKVAHQGNTPNAHFVNNQQAERAVELLRSCFQLAFEEDFLVAFWRLVSNTRAPDQVLPSYKKNPKPAKNPEQH